MNTVEQCNTCSTSDKVHVSISHDIHTWHEILRHCNFEDVIKSHKVVNGIYISDKLDKYKLECNTCTEGKFVNNRNRNQMQELLSPWKLYTQTWQVPLAQCQKRVLSIALLSLMTSLGQYLFIFSKIRAISTVQVTEKFLADCSPYGQVTCKCMRSDNGTEFTSSAFQTLLHSRGIKHKTSCPFSPHPNGTAEGHWRTLFEMGTCRFILIEKQLHKEMWPYAIQTAAHILNRCYKGNSRIKNTP